jgi:hypothetical protein
MLKKGRSDKGGDALAGRMKAISARPQFEAVEKQIDYVSVPRRLTREERHNVYKQATATLAHGEKLDCVIKNISKSGARIEYFRRVQLSDTITISEPTMKLRVFADVVWQREGAAGLRFIRE